MEPAQVRFGIRDAWARRGGRCRRQFRQRRARLLPRLLHRRESVATHGSPAARLALHEPQVHAVLLDGTDNPDNRREVAALQHLFNPCGLHLTASGLAPGGDSLLGNLRVDLRVEQRPRIAHAVEIRPQDARIGAFGRRHIERDRHRRQRLSDDAGGWTGGRRRASRERQERAEDEDADHACDLVAHRGRPWQDRHQFSSRATSHRRWPSRPPSRRCHRHRRRRAPCHRATGKESGPGSRRAGAEWTTFRGPT